MDRSETPPAIAALDTLHSGWTKVAKATVRFGDGETAEREIESHGDGVAVLAYDPARRTALLVRQFRAPVALVSGQGETLEAIAGIVEGDPAACARREAMEEAGLRLGALERVGTFWTMPGVSTERMHLYLAAYGEGDRVAEGGGLADEHERIVVVEIALADLAAEMEAPEATPDLKTLALVQALRLRRPELFAG